jgi:DNA-directed RNA polymerase specialized sigma24 family protein
MTLERAASLAEFMETKELNWDALYAHEAPRIYATWLFKIAQNIGTDHLRARHEHLPLDAVLEVTMEATPERDAEQRSNLRRLALLCRALPERERELVALK